jgi:D-alanyl-D-alanine carboxypeptidase/D-alanyl-D-alanine-endopeptidase (penicillin-binding protein 4)
MKKIVVIASLTLFLTSCSSKKKIIGKQLDNYLSSSFYKNQFTGVLVIDANSKDTIYNQNSDKYFTPASNTKIFTLFAALKSLPEQVPALRYIQRRDTLYFEGTGDPSFLHPYLKDSTTLNFLKNHANLVYINGNFKEDKYGPGWAWDDYQWYYSPERNAFPISGNVVMSYKNPQLTVTPNYFRDSVIEIIHERNRNENENIFYYPPQKTDTLETPFLTSEATTIAILEQVMDKKVGTRVEMPKGAKKTIYGIYSDSLYIRMMHESDNFIAEQLLLLSASEVKDTLNSQIIRSYLLDNELSDLEQQPKWVDGSGLSRYNLFTPQNMVAVLYKLYREIALERLYAIFPAGGVSGTLKNRFMGEKKPYIHAKSGSLSNNYCLSGYLETQSGKTLIFSFMNNHFTQTSTDVRLHLEFMLQTLRDTY